MDRRIGGMVRSMARPRMARRLIWLMMGLTGMGFCIAVFDRIGFGTDPCTTMNLGISRMTGISYGGCQVLFNAILLLIVIRHDLRKIGIGTVANMLLIGYIGEAFMRLFDGIPAMNAMSVPVRLCVFVPTMALFLFVASIYIVVDLGVAPYDAVPMIIADHVRRVPFRTVRICWDVGVLAIGYALGSTVGLTTVVTGFCLGPAIAAVSRRVKGWFE